MLHLHCLQEKIWYTTRMNKNLKELWESFLSAIYPNLRCVFCGKEALYADEGVCEKCLQTLPFITGEVCQKCGMPIAHHGTLCLECKHKTYAFDYARALALFSEQTVKPIYDLKYNHAAFVAEKLGALMASYYTQFYQVRPLVIPVPLFPDRQKERGYNQSELLAKAFCKHTGFTMDTRVVERVKDTPTQTHLNKEERAENLAEAFRVVNGAAITGKDILLIDDVFTTGATTNALSAEIKKYKPKSIGVLTFLKVPLADKDQILQ